MKPTIEKSTRDTVSTREIDIDRVIIQLDELTKTRLHSRAQELRQQIQKQIDALLDEEIGVETGSSVTSTALSVGNR